MNHNKIISSITIAALLGMAIVQPITAYANMIDKSQQQAEAAQQQQDPQYQQMQQQQAQQIQQVELLFCNGKVSLGALMYHK